MVVCPESAIDPKNSPESESTKIESEAFMEWVHAFDNNIQTDKLMNDVLKTIDKDVSPEETSEYPNRPKRNSQANTRPRRSPNAHVEKAEVSRQQKQAEHKKLCPFRSTEMGRTWTGQVCIHESSPGFKRHPVLLSFRLATLRSIRRKHLRQSSRSCDSRWLMQLIPRPV